MKLSQGEKLILLALAAAKDGKEELDLAFIRSAILNGQTWALDWELRGVPTKDTDPAIAEETGEILQMWTFIERSVGQLSDGDRQELEKAAYPFDLQFAGFDGNHDEHHSVASFLIQDMGRFTEFKDRYLNSHSQSSLPKYRRMLPIYNRELEQTGYGGRTLSPEAILRVVKADDA